MGCHLLSHREVTGDWFLIEPAGLVFPTPVLEQRQGGVVTGVVRFPTITPSFCCVCPPLPTLILLLVLPRTSQGPVTVTGHAEETGNWGQRAGQLHTGAAGQEAGARAWSPQASVEQSLRGVSRCSQGSI